MASYKSIFNESSLEINKSNFKIEGLTGEGLLHTDTSGQIDVTAISSDFKFLNGNLELVGLSSVSTTNLAEGTNLYYTDGRFDTRLATKTTDDLAEGTNLYYTTARHNTDFDTRLATKTTDDLAEGTNLYYTDARTDTYIDTLKGAANGLCPLDASTKINISYLPEIALTSSTVVDSEAKQLALDLQEGDVVIRSDENKSYIRNSNSVGDMTDYYLLQTPADLVTSVNGLQGTVVLDTDNINEGLSNLYYTDGRFDTRLATKTTDDVAEGTNLYYTDARVTASTLGGRVTTNESDISTLTTDVDGFPDALKNLTTAEINQLENINTNTISNTQWGYLAGSDQGISTSHNVTHPNITATTSFQSDGTTPILFGMGTADKGFRMTQSGGYTYLQAGNTLATDGKIRLSEYGGTGNLDEFYIGADNTIINGASTFNGASIINGNVSIVSNAQTLNLIGTDHAYTAFYPQGIESGRKAWLGFGSANTNILKIDNESTGANADIHINTEGTIVNRIGDINKFYIDSYNTVVLNRLRVDGTTTIGGDVFYVDTTNDRISYGTTSPLHAFQNELDFTNTAPYYGLDTSKFTYTGGGSTAYKWVDRQHVAIGDGVSKGVIGTYKDLFLDIGTGSTVTTATAFLIPAMSIQAGTGTVTNARSLSITAPTIGTTSNIALYTQNIAVGYTGVSPPSNGAIINGNVSIGKSTNSAPLDVVGNAIVSGSITSGAGSTTINVGTIIGGVARMGNYTYDLAGFGHSGLAIGLNNYAIMQGSNGKTFLNAVTGQPIDFRINNSTVMSMDNTGLDITGNILCDTSLTVNSSVISDASGDLTITPSDNACTVDLSNGAGDGIFTITTGTANKNCVLALVADSDNNDEASNPKLTFSQDGGIVSSYIGYDNATGSNLFIIQNDYVDTDISIRATDTTNTSDVIYIKSAVKRVGINNTNPTEVLDVTGNIKVSGNIKIGGTYTGSLYTLCQLQILNAVDVGSNIFQLNSVVGWEGTEFISAPYDSTIKKIMINYDSGNEPTTSEAYFNLVIYEDGGTRGFQSGSINGTTIKVTTLTLDVDVSAGTELEFKLNYTSGGSIAGREICCIVYAVTR